jgi:hypothetical protein
MKVINKSKITLWYYHFRGKLVCLLCKYELKLDEKKLLHIILYKAPFDV